MSLCFIKSSTRIFFTRRLLLSVEHDNRGNLKIDPTIIIRYHQGLEPPLNYHCQIWFSMGAQDTILYLSRSDDIVKVIFDWLWLRSLANTVSPSSRGPGARASSSSFKKIDETTIQLTTSRRSTHVIRIEISFLPCETLRKYYTRVHRLQFCRVVGRAQQ